MWIAKKEMSAICNHTAVNTRAIGWRGRNAWRIFQKTVSCIHSRWRRRHARNCVGWQVSLVIQQGKYVVGRGKEGGEGDRMWRRRWWRHVLSDWFRNVDLCILFIYSLTAIGLSPGGSTHLHTNNTQNNTNNNRTTQIITSEQHKYKLMW
jgi:hypothetical protein